MFGIEQKGFVPGRAGCVKHTAVTNAIINDIVERKKQLYIISLDIRDSFGSISHDLILENLTSIGTPEKLIKLLMNSYENDTIQMQTTKRFTEKIIIGKGVKQRCSLSPSLFNLGIDPLIRNIRENYQECGDGYDSQEKKGYTSVRR
jgi:retron-type reverse transcriptase